MNDPEKLREAILERLARVIDPETGVDVVRMRLIENLTVDGQGPCQLHLSPLLAPMPTGRAVGNRDPPRRAGRGAGRTAPGDACGGLRGQ